MLAALTDLNSLMRGEVPGCCKRKRTCISLDLVSGLFSVTKPATSPISSEDVGRSLDGQASESSVNWGRVHPGSPFETVGARAPSFPGGVQRDRLGGQPPGRAIGGPFLRAPLNLLLGGLYLPLVIQGGLAASPVDCRSTYITLSEYFNTYLVIDT